MKSNQDYLIDGRVGTLHVAFDWDAPTVDLDASVTVFDDKLSRVDVVWWDKKTSKYLSVRHLGDDKTGDKKGDKELIEVSIVLCDTLKVLKMRKQLLLLGVPHMERHFINAYKPKL